MTEQTDQQETSPMTDVLEFPGQRAAGPASVAATAERLPEVDGPEAEAEVIDFPGARVAEPEPTETEAEAGTDVAVRPDAAPARRVGAVPPALASTARATWTGTKALGRGTAHVARISAPHAKTGSVFVVRHSSYVVGGSWQVTRMAWRRIQHTELDDTIRAARATGDFELVARLQQEKRHSSNDRWRRIGTQLKVTGYVAIGSVGAWCATSVVMAVWGGIAQLAAGGSDWESLWLSGWWAANTSTAGFLVWVASWWPWMLATVALAAGYTVWSTGRSHNMAPASVAAPFGDPSGRDVVPDENAILQALKNLGLPALNKQLKEGWIPRWTEPTQRDGRGWRTQLELPQQVTVEAINDKKAVLAHNLVRKPNEVWPTEPRNKPGVLDLWVADQGILSGKVDPWPLLEDGASDYFQGVPIGIDARGDEVYGALMACNYIVGGTMGSGKTSLIINLLLGAMLDPLVEIDVHVMAYNVDYDPMKPRLRDLVKGDEEEHIEAALAKLRELAGEVTDRGKILDEMGGEETKLTRDIAAKDSRMRPRVVVVDECQELFENDEHGEEAKKLAEKVAKKARKTGITLIWATPSPSASSLPRDLAKTASHRVCFAIGDHQGNDAVLGTGKHKAGITATGLVPGEDVGTAMASGFRRDAGLLRCHHVRKDKEVDQQTPVVQRAVALREEAEIVAEDAPEPVEQERDLLGDLAEVLGTTTVTAAEAAKALVAQHGVAYYRSAGKGKQSKPITATQLSAELGERGVQVPSTGNRHPVDPAAVREALARQATADLDGQDDADDA